MSVLTSPSICQGPQALKSSAPRRIYNPLQKDYATFLETSAGTNGQRTLIEIELSPSGGNSVHYHTAFSERFEVLEGVLHVQVDKTNHTLRSGESATAPVNTPHRFYTSPDQPARFLVELRPGSTGFEQSLQIAYGLAADGKTNQQSLPTNLYHMAVLFTLSQTMVPGLFGRLAPLFRYLAVRARKKGIEQELIRTYGS